MHPPARWLLPAVLTPAFLYSASSSTRNAADHYGQLPLAFEANRGQFDPAIQFFARGEGYSLVLTRMEVVLTLSGHGASAAVRMKFVGANRAPVIRPLDRLPGRTNYFLGDPTHWRTGVPNYARVAYRDLYPGVSAVFYGNHRQVEYDLLLEPGSSPRAIRIEFEGADGLRLESGDLLVSTAAGQVRQRQPVIYQENNGRRSLVDGHYLLLGKNTIGIEIPHYDPGLPLNIDPVLIYSTYLGGDGGASGGVDTGRAIASDGAGNTYVAGTTESSSYPSTGGALATAYRGGSRDGFVTKLGPGGAVVYSTFFGGNGTDEILGIAVDPAGNAYLTGYADSSQFPVTSNAFQTARRGGYEAFVAKLNAAGSALLYCTLLGGAGDDLANAVKVNSAGEAYVAGQTTSPGFPVTPGAFQPSFRQAFDAFVAKLRPDGSGLIYSTLLGGGNDDMATALALDPSGMAYVAGRTASADFPITAGAARKTVQFEDGFVTKLNAEGSALVYSTFVGGSSTDGARGIAVDSAGQAYVAGATWSGDLPVTKSSTLIGFEGGVLDPVRLLLKALRAYRFQNLSGGQDAYVLKLDSAGSSFLGGAYIGGKGLDAANGIAVTSAGEVVLAGETESPDLLVTSGARQSYNAGGKADGFVAKFKADDLSLTYLSYLGGSGEDRIHSVAADDLNGICLTGFTSSANFPTTPGAYLASAPGGGGDAFAAKLDQAGSSFAFTTFLGGGGTSTSEEGLDIAADAAGNAYVTGATPSVNFPVTDSAVQPWYRGGKGTDVFVAKLDPTGRHLLYSTYLGGSGVDAGSGIAVDTGGSAYVAGVAQAGFPVTPGAFQTQLRGNFDVFLAKLSPDGDKLLFSTYLGGSRDEGIERFYPRVALDGSGLPYVAGTTESSDFPTTAGAFRRSLAGGRDTFVTKFKADGSGLGYSTLFGGDKSDDLYGLAVDASGQAYVAGITASDYTSFPTTPGAYKSTYGGSSNVFVAKLNADGSGLTYSTLFGGANSDGACRLAIDSAGAAYIVGFTNSPDFPRTPGSAIAGSASATYFVAKLNSTGSALDFSNRFMLAEPNYLDLGIAVDTDRGVLVAGQTTLQGLPVTDDAPQVSLAAAPDGFVMRFNPDGITVSYATYLAGGGADKAQALAVDSAGNAYVTGQTGSSDFLRTPGAVQNSLAGPRNAFVTKLDLTRTLPVERPIISSVLNYASGQAVLAPGAIITITGDRLAADTLEAGKPLDQRTTPLPTSLGSTVVSAAGRNLPLFSVSPNKIVAQLSYGTPAEATAYLLVYVNGISSRPFTISVRSMAIGILAVYKTDLTPNSAGAKFTAGDTMIAYVTGAGLTNPTVSSAAPAPSTNVNVAQQPERITMTRPENPSQGTSGELQSFTLVPGLVGVAQARILIPTHTEPGAGDQLDLGIGWRNVDSNKYRIYVTQKID